MATPQAERGAAAPGERCLMKRRVCHGRSWLNIRCAGAWRCKWNQTTRSLAKRSGDPNVRTAYCLPRQALACRCCGIPCTGT